MMKRLLAAHLLLVLMLLGSCHKNDPAPAPRQTRRTILLYMPGRSLITYYRQNIAGVEEALRAGAGDECRMLVCYQPENHQNALLQEIGYDKHAGTIVTTTLRTYTAFEAGDTDCVAALLGDVAAEAPAVSYGLVIGCHGKAWIPTDAGTLTSRPAAAGAPAGAALPEEAFWRKAEGAFETRSFGDRGHEMDIAQLAEALERQPHRFDFLLFDDCFMSNIETLYDLRHAVDYVVASPCEIMAAGFPYDRALPWLFAGGDLKRNLGEACRTFYDFYQNDWQTIGSIRSGCIALSVMERMEPLAEAMRRVNRAMRPVDADAEGLQYYEGLSSHLFYDLGHYVSVGCTDEAARTAFAEAYAAAVPEAWRFHTEFYYSAYNSRLNAITHYTGVTTSAPSTRYTAELQRTAWYRATHD